MLRARRTSVAPSVEITPLIDVVFLLLTFFVFALILTVRMDATDIRLPEVRSGEQASLTSPPVIVGMTADGAVSIGDEILIGSDSVIGEEIGQRIRAELIESAGVAEGDLGGPAGPVLPVLMLAIDEQARHGRILELLDALRQAGVSDFRYLRSPQTGESLPESNPGVGNR